MIGAIRALIGMAIGVVAVVAPAWGLYHLLRTPSCGSDGYRNFGPPCPDELALWIAGLVVSLTILTPLAIGIAGRQGGDGPVLLKPLLALIPFGMLAGAIVSGLGPASDPDTRWVAVLEAVIAGVIVVGLLLGFARRGRRRRRTAAAARAASQRAGRAPVASAPTPASRPPAASMATLHDQLSQIAAASKKAQADELAARLKRLDELRAAGSISAAEHGERRREILDEI